MPLEESPKAKYDRLKRQLQDSILSDYPNPERRGCPGAAAIRSLAERADEENVENDEHWQHLTHCSECYREFLQQRRTLKSKVQRRSMLVRSAALAALVLLVGLSFWFFRQSSTRTLRPQNAELAYTKVTIDIPSVTRSENAKDNSPINLPREPAELTVNLPIGSKAGEYEFRLLKGDSQIVKAVATASILQGVTSFTVKIDLSTTSPGSYSMIVRQPPWDWSYVPVVIHRQTLHLKKTKGHLT